MVTFLSPLLKNSSLFCSKSSRTSSGWRPLRPSSCFWLRWYSIPAKALLRLKYRPVAKISRNVTTVKILITKAQAINEHGPTVSPIVRPTASGISTSPQLEATTSTDAVLPDTAKKYSTQLKAAGKTDAIEIPKITVPTHSFVEFAAQQSPSLICEISTTDPNTQPIKSRNSIFDGLKYLEMGTAASRANAKLPQNPDVKNANLSLFVVTWVV